MGTLDRNACVFCFSSSNFLTEILQIAKCGFDTWGGKTYECADCGSQWVSPVPSPSDLEKMYQNDYTSSANELTRWRNDYGKKFGVDRVVLEIGAGKHGMKEDCEGKHYVWDLKKESDFNCLFDFANKELLLKVKALNITDIVALDCYEHVIDPVKFIKNCHFILKDNGFLYLKHGELKSNDGTRRKGLRQSPHINCPSDNAMKILIKGMFKFKGDAKNPAWVLKKC